MSGARLAHLVIRLLSEKKQGRHGYNSPDCPVCIRLSGVPDARSAKGRPRDQRVPRVPSQRHQVVPDCPVRHQTVRCAMEPEVGNSQLRQTRKRIVHCSLSGGALDCPMRPRTEGN
jgi:hypothetical protein